MTEQKVGTDSVEFLRNYAAATLARSIHAEAIMARECAAIQAPIFDRIADELEGLRSRLRAVEAEIVKCEGAYSRDPLTHANTTIEHLVQLATDALDASSLPREGANG